MDIKIEHRLPAAITTNLSKTPGHIAGHKTTANDKATSLPVGIIAKSDAEAKKITEVTQITESERDTLEEAVSDLQEHTQSIQRNLNFSINENTGRTVVEVKDMATGEVIRQLPTEEALRLAESIDEMRSLLFEAEA